MLVSYAILLVILAISAISMNDNSVKNRFMFNAYAISHHREWWRFFSHGVLHADYPHLIFNMLSLYFFAPSIENAFCHEALWGPVNGKLIFILLFLTALPVSCIASFFKNKDNKYYNALGASGAVSAIIFTAILLNPGGTIYLIAFPIPAWLYGICYLAYSFYAAKRSNDNIGHDAHFWGAVYGFAFPVILKFELYSLFLLKLKVIFHLN
jgi:membrane associated rhomboid family serine protease